MSNNQKFMSKDQERSDDWDDCSQGELSRMVHKLDATQARARTKKLVQTGLLGMLLIAGGVVVGGSLFTQSSYTFGGITCAECKSHFAEYHGHMTGSELLEDMGLTTSMATHLASCPHCHVRFNEHYPGVLPNRVSISAQPVMRSPLPLLAVSRQSAFY